MRRVVELVAECFPAVELVSAPRPPGDPLGGFADTEVQEAAIGHLVVKNVDVGIHAYLDWIDENPHVVPSWLS